MGVSEATTYEPPRKCWGFHGGSVFSIWSLHCTVWLTRAQVSCRFGGGVQLIQSCKRIKCSKLFLFLNHLFKQSQLWEDRVKEEFFAAISEWGRKLSDISIFRLSTERPAMVQLWPTVAGNFRSSLTKLTAKISLLYISVSRVLQSSACCEDPDEDLKHRGLPVYQGSLMSGKCNIKSCHFYFGFQCGCGELLDCMHVRSFFISSNWKMPRGWLKDHFHTAQHKPPAFVWEISGDILISHYRIQVLLHSMLIKYQ